ncbi:hypothetical protein ACWCQL_01420 [Streptomyces sp. NPDC002073]
MSRVPLETNAGACYNPAGHNGQPSVWLITSGRTPFCELPELDARGLLFALGKVLGLTVYDPAALSEAAE